MSSCPQCGAEIRTVDALFGLCPNCLHPLKAAERLEAQAEQPPTVTASAQAAQPGQRFGRYRAIRLLGEGGMGIVYLAEQEEPVRRRVAVKLIKLGMDTQEIIARFESERQALALMDHP